MSEVRWRKSGDFFYFLRCIVIPRKEESPRFFTPPCFVLNDKNYTLILNFYFFINNLLQVIQQKYILDKNEKEESEVTNEASFTNDLGADSLDTVELIMEFEKEFGISIPDDQAEKIGTVGDAVSYIEEHAK